MIDLKDGLRLIVSRTSRRGVLEKLGKGLMGAALVSVARPELAQAKGPPIKPNSDPGPGGGNCSYCGGCGGIPCGSQDQGCCPGCSGPFCDVQTGGTCPPGTGYGWWWYCCRADGLYICQDCCDAPNHRLCTSPGRISTTC